MQSFYTVIQISLGAMVFLVMPFSVGATDFTSTSYTVMDPVIFPAGYSTSTDYQLQSTITQIAIGTSTATNLELRSGFLYFPAPTLTPTPTPTPTPSPSPSSGNGKIIQLIIETILETIGIPPPLPGCIPVTRTDLNCDQKVNLIDLSIFLFLSPAETASRVADFNGDDKVDLRDLSILFSDWNERVLTFTPEKEFSPFSEPKKEEKPAEHGQGGFASLGEAPLTSSGSPSLVGATEKTQERLGKTLTSTVSTIGSFFSSIFSGIVVAFQALWNGITSIFPGR